MPGEIITGQGTSPCSPHSPPHRHFRRQMYLFKGDIFSPAVGTPGSAKSSGFAVGEQSWPGSKCRSSWFSSQSAGVRSLLLYICRHLPMFLAGRQLPMWHNKRVQAERSAPAQEHPRRYSLIPSLLLGFPKNKVKPSPISQKLAKLELS